ncbi:site-specific integrase [Undibacterium sp. TJN19]|uniref:site-specific integrase n=1 Tax=Undibacterium sp. TJN19 TaxID=3413055 RepID=UPI003BF17BEA
MKLLSLISGYWPKNHFMDTQMTIQSISPSANKNAKRLKPDQAIKAPTRSLVESYTAAAQSKATQHAYNAAVRHFKQHGGTIPATPAMVAEYIAKFADSLAVATLQHRLVAIHRAHSDIGIKSPVMDKSVKRTMQGIRRTFGTSQRRVTALVKDDLLEIMILIDQQSPLKAARDKALLLIGFAGAFRRSELVALKIEDVSTYDTGLEILLKRSKTDQEGAGRTVFIPYAKGNRCPVKALQGWLMLANITEGAMFRPVSRHDTVVSKKSLTPQSVALILKAAVRRVGGEEVARNVAGHSLRAGYCTEAAMAGLQPYQIREQTGHKSDVTLARYIRPVSKRKIPSLL